MIKRILYLAYYFRELDWARLNTFMDYVSRAQSRSRFSLWCDVILSSLKYNVSILEYFNFRFYSLPPAEREQYAGTGYMYEYQLKMNPRDKRVVLSDKIRFLHEYHEFVKHEFSPLSELERDKAKAARLLQNQSGKVVLKSSDGQCGRGIEVKSTNDLSVDQLIQSLKSSGNDYAEEFVVQHDDLMKLSPAGLNTVRIITQLNEKDEVDILGARLRITINSSVDNLAAGNIAAPIDITTGRVEGPGVYSDITKADEHVHPATGVAITGFQVPYWRETLDMIVGAALKNKGNRSIGWDVAITNRGPELIEGNHDWCKLLWQLPAKKGLKPVLENYTHSKA